jgi:peptidoglycan/LPS O-acetylase OafA/YrhL
MLVLFHHSFDQVVPWAQYGTFGVQIFFVLSGFLITWLLCVEEGKHGTISLPAFYARRSLRILPPAFLYIAVVSLLGLIGLADVARNEPLFSAFFVRNIMEHGGIHLGHFWTLAIEEQFYLLWPLGFLLLKSVRQRLVFCVILFIAAPFWARVVFKLQDMAWHAHPSQFGAKFLTLASGVNPLRFDLEYSPLIAGCALALLRQDRELCRFASSRILRSTPVALLAVAAMAAGCANLPTPFLASSLSTIGVAVFINFAVQSESGVIGGFLNWAPVMWIGGLSYSLYLWQQVFCYHSRLPWFGQFPQNVIAAFIAASLSYYLLEIPLAKVRKRIHFIANPRLLSPELAFGWARETPSGLLSLEAMVRGQRRHAWGDVGRPFEAQNEPEQPIYDARGQLEALNASLNRSGEGSLEVAETQHQVKDEHSTA